MELTRKEEESSWENVATNSIYSMKSADSTTKNGVRFSVQNSNFRSFIEENSQEYVVDFFKRVVREVEEKRGLLDFRLKIMEEKEWFCVDVHYGDREMKGPQESGECISCLPGAALFPGQEPGITAGECVLAEFSDQPHVQCSLDSSARSGYVVTPVRHVERMSQLRDDELYALWSTAVRALRQDRVPFTTMALKHGAYKNSPHLRLKVWVDNQWHRQARLKWGAKRKGLWNRLLDLAAKTSKYPCEFYHNHGYCRYGEQCRFSHD